MKILMIDAGYNNYEFNEPLGIEVLASCVEKKFENVEVIMLYSLVEDVFVDIDFDVLCISANIYDNGNYAKIIEFYKSKKSEKFPIIIGGVLPTLAASALLIKFPQAICIVGEGELALIQLTEQLLNDNLDLNKVNNIAFLNKNNEIIFTSRKVYDLNKVDYLPKRKYLQYVLKDNGLVRMETSRGCDWNQCSFCILDYKFAGEKRRFFPIEIVTQELINLSNKGVKIIYFTDEEFLGYNIDRLHQFISIIRNYKSNGKIHKKLNFFASTSVQCINFLNKNCPEILSELKEIGFTGFFIGVESFSNSQLKRYKKGVNKEDNINVLRILASYGFIADLGFILFDPLMTFDELKENIEFILKYKIDNSYSRLLKFMRIIPNTKYCSMYFEAQDVEKKFLIDSAEYRYDYVDKRVREIVCSIKEYLNQTSQKAYELQASIRARKENWEEAENELQKLREDEITFLVNKVATYDKV